MPSKAPFRTRSRRILHRFTVSQPGKRPTEKSLCERRKKSGPPRIGAALAYWFISGSLSPGGIVLRVAGGAAAAEVEVQTRAECQDGHDDARDEKDAAETAGCRGVDRKSVV